MAPKRELSEVPSAAKTKVFKRPKRMKPRSVPYDDSSEDLPQLPAYHPSFEEAKEVATNIYNSMLEKVNDLKDRGFQDDIIDKHTASLREIQFPERKYPKPKRVGFLGDMGAGKSSLINSLLGETVTKESDGAKTGTCVIQEFVKAGPGQSKAYEAKVYFHSQERIKELVEKYLEDIYEDLTAPKAQLTLEAVAEHEWKRETAFNFFTTLLGDQPDFATKESTIGFFAPIISREVHSEMIAKLFTLILAFVDQLGCEQPSGIKTFASDKLSDVHKSILKLCSPKHGQLSAWPLISRAQIRLKTRLLDESIVLVDLPGIADTNRARVEATMEYLKTCSVIVISNPIKRIVDHVPIADSIRECERLGKTASTMLAATMTDVIQLNEFNDEDDEDEDEEDNEGSRPLWPDEDYNDLLELREKVRELEASLDDHDEAIDDRRKAKSPASDSERQQILQNLEAAKCRVYQKHIEMRSNEAISALQAKYAGIPVFCVSNKAYQQHLQGYDLLKPPSLDVEATGIPSLRRMLYRFPATEKMDVVRKICHTELPLALNGLDLCCGKPLSQRKADVEATISGSKAEFVDTITTMRKNLAQDFEKHICAFIKINEAEWHRNAKKMSGEWVKQNHATVRAICRNYGEWVRKKFRSIEREPHIWNHDLIKIFEDDLLARFAPLQKKVAEQERDFVRQLNALMLNLRSQLQHHLLASLEERDTLLDSLSIRCRNLASDARETFAPLQKAILDIRGDITDPSANGYMRKSLRSTYKSCNELAGTGAHNKRSKILVEKMGSSIFTDCGNKAKKVFDKELMKWESNAVKIFVEGTLENTAQDASIRLKEAKENDPQDQCFRDELRLAVREAKAKVDKELLWHLDQCAAYASDEAGEQVSRGQVEAKMNSEEKRLEVEDDRAAQTISP